MPLQARRCHVALSGFRGPCGQVSEEAAGAGVMVASMARAVMDLRICQADISADPLFRQSHAIFALVVFRLLILLW